MTDPATSSERGHEINQAITQLRALTQVNVQLHWRCCPQDLPVAMATHPEQWNDWSMAELNPKEYIVWSAGRQVMWLGQLFVIPQTLQGYPLAGLALRLALTWWAEAAQIFINGQLVQQGDLFDSSARVMLSEAVVPGEKISVALRLVSPGHDIGALMGSCCVYESIDSIEPGFVADELAVLQNYLDAFEPEKIEIFAAALVEINWEVVSQKQEFDGSLSTLRQNLQSQIPNPKSKIHLLGHAHLDLAWLWPVSETWEVAQRTFESVLKLQQEFPDLTFCHSTPALYAWIEQHRPDLFAAIKQQIAQGRWEVVGGMWVEPELNLINGESIVRQILYAQRYVQEKFGQLTTVAWVPDSFGFCWQLPQILKQGGIEYFVTQKLHWNDTTKFPYGVFWWRSPDGSQIFSLMSPPNTVGVMDTNPLTMASYAINWETQTHLKDAFWLPGVGDHGGGPTRDMLQVAKRSLASPFFPRLEFTTAHAYLQQIRTQLETVGAGLADKPVEDSITSPQNPPDSAVQESISPSPDPIPVWNDELYLEFHRGCYTTHADQKRWNRRCEGLLYQAELFASLATLSTNTDYPKTELEDAWKKVLFNQFHDILPGTSIPEVFVEANTAWQEVEQVGLKVVEQSLRGIASQIALPLPPQPNAQPIIVFNPLNWQHSELVAVSLPGTGDWGQQQVNRQNSNPQSSAESTEASWEIYDLSGQKLPSQLTEESTLLFLAKDIPSIGYRVFWLCPIPIPHSPFPIPHSPDNFVLENEWLRVVVDPNTGDLSSVFDKIQQREVLSGAGNQLQAFQDSGQYWDAWNIDPNYAQHPLPPTQLKSIQWMERGELRSRLRVVRQLGQSQFCQDYILDTESPLLKIATTVDWQERHVLVKAGFPLNVEANYATYEIPCGAIQRPTRPQTPAEQAKWEVSALHWADIGDTEYGVSLLNDCKYGYDAQASQLRLTLLRSPCWPDSEADRGIHQFTYVLYPHNGSWQSAGTVQRGYELNIPLIVLNNSPVEICSHKPLQPMGQLLDLQAPNLVLMAFKQSEDASGQWIIRCYECEGASADLSLKSDLDLAIAHSVDLLERPIQTCEPLSSEQTFKIAPWKIATFALMPTSNHHVG
ncbi:alpha-mannosidase [Allocoleopsis franciscana]|uniref:Alpha-mannosidase n=1 Tax=Allocoleopsis franciscana PCC 7113 TaxID=1173027 RepID=K9WJG1_9CYAN|nr:alpha-mannosidase [Allocoleopsis franciscana]AFZ19951.1 alpha-mannosidase [Allocoleopsis franciscana PCC 7113]